jgi:hypothetical protein
MEKIIAHPSPWGDDTTALPKGYYNTLLGLMPDGYQRHSLQVLLRLFLQAQGHQEGGKASEAATSGHTVAETLPSWSFQKNFRPNFCQNGNTHSIKCMIVAKMQVTKEFFCHACCLPQ